MAALINLSLEPANKVRDSGVLASGHRTPAAVFKRFRDAGVASSTLVDVSDRIGEKHRPIAGDLHMESLLVSQPYRKYRAYKTLNLARIIRSVGDSLSFAADGGALDRQLGGSIGGTSSPAECNRY